MVAAQALPIAAFPAKTVKNRQTARGTGRRSVAEWYLRGTVLMTDQAVKNHVPAGTRFGRYEVIAEIASGGMATVYLGRALGAAGFTRLVAIKLMHPHVGKDEEFIAMFMDEARLAARIRHPNVVPTLDLENGDDGLFLVMEYIEGDGLLNLMRLASKAGARIPAPVVLRIGLDILNGLHAAHELTGDRGEPLKLVHRDVSPHNILLGIDGIARITDFGIARAEERISATRDGQIKGKLAYMAPEQTSATPVDRRADLFSTGVVLWECLAGRRLFHGQNDGEVLRNLLANPIPRLRSIVPDLPEALDAVCARALEREPDNRFVNAAQFAEALEEAGGSLGIGSARAVSQYVREISGERIAAMAGRVRDSIPDANTSAVRPTPRKRAETDPERTIRREEVDEAQLRPIPNASAIGPPPLTSTSVVPPESDASGGRRRVLAVVALIVFMASVIAGGFAVRDARERAHGSALSAETALHTTNPPSPVVLTVTPATAPVPVVPVAVQPTIDDAAVHIAADMVFPHGESQPGAVAARGVARPGTAIRRAPGGNTVERPTPVATTPPSGPANGTAPANVPFNPEAM